MNIIQPILSLIVILLTACSASEPSYLSSDEPKALLSETMLYQNIATKEVRPELRGFSPKFPLWSDGAGKERWIFLPGVIDTSDQNNWVFPKGTTIFKEFSFHGARVETRLMEKVGDGVGLAHWRFATYRWRDDGLEADRVPDEGALDVAATAFPGVSHDIPSQVQCQRCHTRSGEPVLGFSATQLDAGRNAHIPHGSLRPEDLTNEKLFASQAISHAVTHVQEEILTPVELAAVGFLHGNCGTCHGPGGVRESLGMGLNYDQNARDKVDLPVYKTAVNVPTTPASANGTAPEGYAWRIKAGHPEQSYLHLRLMNRGNILQMPPFGTEAVDEEAAALIQRWIREMAP